jgi:preprotein translocase subunit SecG
VVHPAASRLAVFSPYQLKLLLFASGSALAILPVRMPILINILLAIWMVVALIMILVILMQRPKSEGLGAAFGGGVTENIFGAQTTNVLVKFTGYLAAIFFVLTFFLSILYAKRGSGDSALRQELMKTQAAPQASAAPGATTPVPGTSLPAAATTAPVVPPASVPVAPSVAPANPATSPSAPPKP